MSLLPSVEPVSGPAPVGAPEGRAVRRGGSSAFAAQARLAGSAPKRVST